MKVVILCGGKGIRVGNEVNFIPKAMVKVGYRPIVWYIMKRYALARHNEFILALGSKGEQIRDYFTRYSFYTNDLFINLTSGITQDLTKHQETDWKITLVDTGDSALSGARIYRCREYLDENEFMVAYSDCLADIDIEKLIAHHRMSKKIATITGIIPPYREGELLVDKTLAVGFYNAAKVKSATHNRYINGGFMVFKKEIFSYLNSFNECKLETEVFSELIKDRQLSIYPHHGFWRWLDTERDYHFLNDLVDKNKIYWLYE